MGYAKSVIECMVFILGLGKYETNLGGRDVGDRDQVGR